MPSIFPDELQIYKPTVFEQRNLAPAPNLSPEKLDGLIPAVSASRNQSRENNAYEASPDGGSASLLHPIRPPPYAAAATLPLKVRPNLVAEIVTFSPSFTRPDRIISASGSCTLFWITRLSGRAP